LEARFARILLVRSQLNLGVRQHHEPLTARTRLSDTILMDTRQAIVRLEAVVAALDEALAESTRRDSRWELNDLRADLDLVATREEFEREHATLQESARSTRQAADQQAKESVAWAQRASQAANDSWEWAALLEQQALARQREHSAQAAVLYQEAEAFEQLVADYATILAELRRRAEGGGDSVSHGVA
jgi:hypothetical protein